MKGNTKHLAAVIFVFTVIAIAYACRMLAKFDIGGPAVNHIRSALYLLLFALWGFSLDRRIIQRQALHCLRLTAALILLWLILRTLKYSVVTGLTAARYVWYLYYLPMLFLPLLGGVHRPVHGKAGGLPSEPEIRYAVDRPCGAVFAGDHQ